MIRLNLGSGDNYHDGWINLDIVKRAAPIDMFADVTRLPFADESVDAIYAGHLLEHMYPIEASQAIRHWLGKLSPQGRLGIVTPDVQKVAGITKPRPSILARGAWSLRYVMECVGGWRDPNDPYALHVSCYTHEQLIWFVMREVERARGLPYRGTYALDLHDWPVDSYDDWQTGVEVR